MQQHTQKTGLHIMRTLSIAAAVIILAVSMLIGGGNASAATRLKVSPVKKTIYVGKTVKLTANQKVKWSVSKKKVAKLTKAGKKTVTVKGLKAGTAYVTAKAGKTAKKVRITVKAKPQKIRLTTSKDMIGLGEYCTVIVHKGSSTSSSSNYVFTSSDKTIAFVNNRGLVQGLGEGFVTITAKSKADKSVKASVTIQIVPAKAGIVTLKVDLSDEERYPAGKTAKVWLPVPQNDGDQSVSAVRYDAPGAKTAQLTKDSSGGRQLYVEWSEETAPADRVATLSYHVYRRAVVRPDDLESLEKGTVDAQEFAEELKETRWSGSLTSGIVKETADQIVAGAPADTVYARAFAIYDWICDNMIRTDDKTVIFGDVVSILNGDRLAGSCMDVNSVFTALCRAEGIPARNQFGLRFAPKTGQKIGPNCRAQFYLPGYGWVVADPALAIKQGRGLDAEPRHDHDPTWEGIKDYFWGSAEENWLCVNMGRDITLDPAQSVVPGEYLEVLNPEGTINLYMFPYGEYGGQYIPCQKAGEFRYEYSFVEEDPTDCGC